MEGKGYQGEKGERQAGRMEGNMSDKLHGAELLVKKGRQRRREERKRGEIMEGNVGGCSLVLERK